MKKKVLCLFLGIIVLFNEGLALATHDSSAWSNDVIGRVSWIGACDAGDEVVVEVIAEDSEVYYFSCSGGSSLVPILTLAYQTQSTCYIATSDTNLGTNAILSMDTAYLSSSDLDTNATSDDVTSILSVLDDIKNYIKKIFRILGKR